MKAASFCVLVIYLSVVRVFGVPLTAITQNEDVMHEILPDIIHNSGNQATLNGILFKTVIRYFCSLPQFRDDSTTILYGTNGWTFPEQDVNLTLSYPTSDKLIRRQNEYDDYRISGYQVIMFTDGSDSTGYIASGGLLKDRISLNFNMSGISVLSYEFWLYGVPAAVAEASPSYHNTIQMC